MCSASRQPSTANGCGSRGDREPHASSASPAASTTRPRIASAESRSPSTMMPEDAGRQRLAEGQGRGRRGGEPAEAPREQHVRDRDRREAEPERHHEPAVVREPGEVDERQHERREHGRARAHRPDDGERIPARRRAVAAARWRSPRTTRPRRPSSRGARSGRCRRVAAGLAAEAEQHARRPSRARSPASRSSMGTRRVSAHSSSPARIGAEPSATTVPTATPLRSVPRKKSGW